MKGSLGFNNHKVSCTIGIGEKERSAEQDLHVDLRVTADVGKCAKTDRLEDTIDYMALADLCTGLAKKNGYHLLETFAVDVLEAIFDKYPVEEAWIRIKKPQALATADCTVVELTKVKE